MWTRLNLFDDALRWVEDLQKRDAANPGFVQLKVTVLQCGAAGYIAWAKAAHKAERTRYLDRAQEYLDRADELIGSLKSQSLQTFLRHDLKRTAAELQSAKQQFQATPAE